MDKLLQKRGHWLSSGIEIQFCAWLHSLRTPLMFVFILCINYMMARSYESMIATLGYKVHLGESLFYYINSGFNVIITTAFLLLMISEIPRSISFQNYALLRMTRKKWLVSLVIFCFLVICLMIIFMIAFSAALTLPHTSPGRGWSDLERLEADIDYLYEPQLVSEYVRTISPFKACLYASMVLFSFWFTMVLVILTFSLFGNASLGLIAYMFILLMSITVRYEMIPNMKTPIHFATMSAITARYPGHELEAVKNTIFAYMAIDCTLIVIMLMRVRYTDLYFIEKE